MLASVKDSSIFYFIYIIYIIQFKKKKDSSYEY